VVVVRAANAGFMAERPPVYTEFDCGDRI